MKRAKFLSLLLTFAMLLSLVSIPALAAEDTADQPTEKTETTGETTASKTFEDVSDHWGKTSVERWAGYGVLNGDPAGNFNPDAQMTRAEFATMLVNMLGYTEKAENTFADVPADAWFADAVLKLAAAGVMKGDGTNANPNAPISRQEAAVLLCRAFNIAPSKDAKIDFADGEAVADWASDAVAALTERGMIAGVGENNFAPVANITRASVAKLADNMVAEYVTADKEITGEVKGLVVVAGDAEVTIKDAKLSENVIVAPKAGEAEVTLTGKTTAGNIYVQSDASAVKVEKDATAASVLVDASKASVEVAGKVESIMTTETAAEAAVTVAKGATVDAVALAGEDAKLDVTGTVKDVEVSSTAKGADIVANQGAKITNVTTSAEDVKVSGKGTVSNVTANAGSADVTTKGTKVKNDGADKVTAGGKEVADGKTNTTPGGSTGGGGGGGGGSDPEPSPEVSQISAVTKDTSLNGAPDDAEANVKYVLDGTTVNVSGILQKVEGFTDYWDDAAQNAGYFLVFKITVPAAQATAMQALDQDVFWLQSNVGGGTADDFANGWKSFKGNNDGLWEDDNQSIIIIRKLAGDVAEPTAANFQFAIDFDGDGKDYAKTTYTVDVSDVILTATELKLLDQTGAVRGVGAAEGIDGTFDYAAAYEDAGVTATGGSAFKYVVDSKELLDYIAAGEGATNQAAVNAMTHEDNLYIGVTFAKPGEFTAATKVAVSTDGLTGTYGAPIVLAGDDGDNLFGHEYIQYFGFAGKDGKNYADKTWAYTFKWLNDEDAVIGYSESTITRETKFTVTFDMDGGTPIDPAKVAYDSTLDELDLDPTKDDSVFKGWTLDGAAYDTSAKITSNITLKATWAESVTVTLDANGGGAMTQNTIKVEKGTEIDSTKIETPIWAGREFVAWFEDATCATAFDFTKPVTAATTLYAQWKAVAEITVMSDATLTEGYVDHSDTWAGVPGTIADFGTGIELVKGDGNTYAAAGSLKYVTGFTSFGEDGNFIPIQFVVPNDAATHPTVIITRGEEEVRDEKTMNSTDEVESEAVYSVILIANEKRMTAGHKYPITVDWDGPGSDVVLPTEYFIDLTGLTLEAKPELTNVAVYVVSSKDDAGWKAGTEIDPEYFPEAGYDNLATNPWLVIIPEWKDANNKGEIKTEDVEISFTATGEAEPATFTAKVVKDKFTNFFTLYIGEAAVDPETEDALNLSTDVTDLGGTFTVTIDGKDYSVVMDAKEAPPAE